MTSTSLNYTGTTTSTRIDPFGIYNPDPMINDYYYFFNDDHKWAGYYYKVRAQNEDKAKITMYQTFDKGWNPADPNIRKLNSMKELTDEIIKEEKIQPLNPIEGVY